jgi:hypothetical protein
VARAIRTSVSSSRRFSALAVVGVDVDRALEEERFVETVELFSASASMARSSAAI